MIQDEQWSAAIVPYSFAKILDFFLDSRANTRRTLQNLDTDDSQGNKLISVLFNHF